MGVSSWTTSLRTRPLTPAPQSSLLLSSYLDFLFVFLHGLKGLQPSHKTPYSLRVFFVLHTHKVGLIGGNVFLGL